LATLKLNILIEQERFNKDFAKHDKRQRAMDRNKLAQIREKKKI
jgi:hypothetical protein